MSRYLNESDGYLAYEDQHVIAEAIRLYRVDKHLLEQIEKEDINNNDRFYEMTKETRKPGAGSLPPCSLLSGD